MNNKYPNNSQQPGDPNRDLSWLALRYVSNELAPQARRQFEIRLEHDQTARESVVRAFDDARLLDLAISSTNNQITATTHERPDHTSQLEPSPQPVRSTRTWSKALLGIAAAGLLAMIFTQLPWDQTRTEVTLNTGTPNVTNHSTETSMSLAEIWADSDWQADLQAVTEDTEHRFTSDDQLSYLPETLEDTEQDDWMTDTLLDMAKNLPQSGS